MHLDLLSIPQSGENIPKHLVVGGIIGCKTKPLHGIQAHRYTVVEPFWPLSSTLLFLTLQGKETNFRGHTLTQNKVQKNKIK